MKALFDYKRGGSPILLKWLAFCHPAGIDVLRRMLVILRDFGDIITLRATQLHIGGISMDWRGHPGNKKAFGRKLQIGGVLVCFLSLGSCLEGKISDGFGVFVLGAAIILGGKIVEWIHS